MRVSVSMVTYNHEKYIAEAIESVLAQQVNFDFELVIGEDCSTDRTREIVLDYARKHPTVIRPLLHEKNIGMGMNDITTMRACRGEYIALLEGDDYWIDPHKLQKQVAFLDAHPDYSACFARAGVFSDHEHQLLHYFPSDNVDRQYLSIEDLLRKNYIATCTFMFRNVIATIDYEPIKSLLIGDWPFFLLLSLEGPIGYCNDVMAAYRQHSNGIWTRQDQVGKLEAVLQMYRVIGKYYSPQKYVPLIRQYIVKNLQSIAIELLRRGDRRPARAYTIESILSNPAADNPRFGWFLKRSCAILIGSLFPSFSWEKHL